MKRATPLPAVGALLLVLGSCVFGASPKPACAFTVSMERPYRHLYQVQLHCTGLPGGALDFKMPAWAPGYYQILDFARQVVHFTAADERGRPLPWEKAAKNVWRVSSGRSAAATIGYDVYAHGRSVAESTALVGAMAVSS